jgi:hypothetical protein
MKANLLKMSVITTMVIFLFAGASWADGAENRHHKQARNKHIRTEHHRSDGYLGPSHYSRRWYELPQKYHRPARKHDRYRHQVICKHYHKHKPSYNLFSYRVQVFEPGWFVGIKTKSRW